MMAHPMVNYLGRIERRHRRDGSPAGAFEEGSAGDFVGGESAGGRRVFKRLI